MAKKNPMIRRYGTGHGTSARHRDDFSIRVKAIDRAMEQAFTSHRTASGEGVLDVWQQRTRAKCHRCEERTDAVNLEEENGMQSVDRNQRLGIQSIGNCCKWRKQDLNVKACILRLLILELEEVEGSPDIKPEI
jgi:hypothetical protein